MLRTLQLVTTPRPFFEQQLRVLDRNGIDCTVVPVPGTAGERSLLPYGRFYARTLRRLLEHGGFDVVHANYGLTAPAAIAQPVRPVILSLWGSDLMGRYGQVSRVCAALSDEVVTMSGEMADSLDRDCHVVPHGIDTERFAPAPTADAQVEVGWDPDASHVLFPYDPSRDVKDYPRAERVVATARESVEGPVELHAVHGVSHERVPTYMNAADALLLTSRREGSPNAVKEALACSRPVVATAVGDVPALLDGVEGTRACDSDEELVAGLVDALDGPGRSDGRAHARAFNLDRMATELLDVYDAALDGEVAV